MVSDDSRTTLYRLPSTDYRLSYNKLLKTLINNILYQLEYGQRPFRERQPSTDYPLIANSYKFEHSENPAHAGLKAQNVDSQFIAIFT